MSAAFKTFPLRFALPIEGIGLSADVALASVYGHFLIVLPRDPQEYPCDTRLLFTLSTVVHEDPFPAPGPNGSQRFYMKTYGENEGILEKLEGLGVLRRTGNSRHQGFADFPVVEICLEEADLVHACAAHVEEYGPLNGQMEVAGGSRVQRCVQCKQVYYCNQEVSLFDVSISAVLFLIVAVLKCQKRHWPIHKKDCRIAQRSPSEGFALIENRRRAGMQSYLSESGFQVLNV